MDRQRERLHARALKGDVNAFHALARHFARRAPPRRRARIRRLTRAVERGDVDAQGELAWWSFDAGEVLLARVWWQWACEAGLSRSDELLDLHRHAAELGIPSAMGALGDSYVGGSLGVRKDLRRGVMWLRRAAEMGDPGACLSIEVFQDQSKLDGLISRRELVRWLRRAAKLGDAGSQVSLGVKLDTADGVRMNLRAAARWYRKAAVQGEETAWLHLGYMYEDGQGVRRSWRRARACYHRAAILGERPAYRYLVEHYEGGGGARPNPRLVATWIRRAEAAARSGNAEVCEFLGAHFGREESDAYDPRRAVLWLRRGAAKNHDTCLMLLGWHVHGGIGVKRDRARAVRLYRRAIELGNARAAYQLGLCYRDGEGVRRDPREARRWLKYAAQKGETIARRLLAKVGKRALAAEPTRAPSAAR